MALMALMCTSCTQVKLASVNLTQFTFDGEVVRSRSYGDDPRQSLDIYLPEKKLSNETWPVLMFVHGGRWSSGERTDYAFIGATFAQLGYIVVVPAYRLYPQVKLPGMMADIADAALWVNRNIGQYQAQMDNIFLMGHSSGAHMAAMLVSDERYLKAKGLKPDMFNAVVGLAGPYDFTPTAPDLVDLFGPESNFAQMKVTNFINGDEPPFYLAHGLRDELVLVGNMERLEDKIKQRGGTVQSKLYREMNHEDMLKAFTWVGAGKTSDVRPLRDDVFAYLRNHMKNDGIMVRPGVAEWRSYRGVSGGR